MAEKSTNLLKTTAKAITLKIKLKLYPDIWILGTKWFTYYAALLGLAMKILADLHVHKTMHQLLQIIYVKLYYYDINVISNETVH